MKGATGLRVPPTRLKKSGIASPSYVLRLLREAFGPTAQIQNFVECGLKGARSRSSLRW